jgi:MoaA/NifB/PqqE/SkfB family radical SAM enzyme
MRRRLEIALDYRCNLRCIGCHACHDTGERMSAQDAVRLLRSARERGVTSLWIGGGEPTLREDMLAVAKSARDVGFEEVVVQTNGMRLAYAAYRDALLAAGVTHVRVNVKSHRASVHDRLSGGVDGCHGLLVDAIAGLVERGVRPTADVLLARSTVGDLPETIAFFAERGVGGFALWLLSAADADGDDSVEREVPRITEAVPFLEAAAKEARARGVELVSFHTPPCTLPPELRAIFSPAKELAMVVAGPDGKTFPLESSSFEGGARVEACAACAERARCGGPRADYVRIHGANEFRAIGDAGHA